MPEFIAMLGSAPGPKSLGQSPQQQIPNFSVTSIANQGNLRGIPDFSVNSIARRGNLRGLGQITAGSFSAGAASGVSTNLFTGNAAASSPAVANAALGGCSATIPFSAFVQMANSKMKAWASFRSYADRAFIPAMLGTEGVDFYRRQAEATQAFKALTEPWSTWPSFNSTTYKNYGSGRVGQAARYVDKVKNDPRYLTGPYKMEDETIAFGAPFVANALVVFYNAKKAQYDANPELFKAEVINEFLLVRAADPTSPAFAESTALNVATAYVGASIPGVLKGITSVSDVVTTYARAQDQSGQKDTTRTDGGLFLNTLIDAAQGFKSANTRADPVSGENKVSGYPDLVGKILAAAMVIANNVENWSGVAGLPPVRVALTPNVVQALDLSAPDAIRMICSFDRNLLVDPAKRGYISTPDAEAQKAQAIKDAIAAAQLVTVPEDRRLYSFSQLQAAKEAAKQAAFSNCTLSAMDQAEIDKRVGDAISTRRLQTPAEVEAAINAAVQNLQGQLTTTTRKYDDLVVSSGVELEKARSAGTNKMLIAAGAVAAVAVVAFFVFGKKA